jgi:hypothetical protein
VAVRHENEESDGGLERVFVAPMRIMCVHATNHSCVRRLCANRIVDALLIAKVYLNSGVVCVIRAAPRVDEDESKGRQSECGRLDGFKRDLNHSWSLADSALFTWRPVSASWSNRRWRRRRCQGIVG